MDDILVQYIVIRKDMQKYSKGAFCAQAAHAATAAIHTFYNQQETQSYLSDLQNMHKIVLQIDSEEELKQLHLLLEENKVDHFYWSEMPEDQKTAIATRPYCKQHIQKHFLNFKLFR